MHKPVQEKSCRNENITESLKPSRYNYENPQFSSKNLYFVGELWQIYSILHNNMMHNELWTYYYKGKVKVNVDLYSALSWTLL